MADTSQANPTWVTTAEAAVRLNMTARRITRLVSDGEIVGVRLGFRWMISVASIDKILASLEVKDKDSV